MASRFAQLVDALNRESRQILHYSSETAQQGLVRSAPITNSGLTELK
jgi:hypothetical protein